MVFLIGTCSCSGDEPVITAPSVEVTPADQSSSWPRFHGADGSNISSDTGLLKQWPEGGPQLAVTIGGIGHGFSGVTIAGGRIFTAGNIGEKTVVTALDLEGNILWQAENGQAWNDSYEGSRGTPTVDGEFVYHQSPYGELSCFNVIDGVKVWGVNVLTMFGAENIRWGLAESVLVDGDLVITCPGGSKASVAALDKKTGKMMWTAASTGANAGYSSPAVAEFGGLRIVLTMNATAFIGIDVSNGNLLWTYGHETDYEINATTPIFHDGQVFITSGYGSGSEMLKINVDGDKAAVEKVWESSELDNQHGGVILIDGYLYAAAHKKNRGKWICLDWRTGALKYAEKGVGMGSATAADGMLYTLSEKGVMGLVSLNPDAHTVISSFKHPDGGEGKSWAHPVVCGRRLYLRQGEKLFVYDIRG